MFLHSVTSLCRNHDVIWSLRYDHIWLLTQPPHRECRVHLLLLNLRQKLFDLKNLTMPKTVKGGGHFEIF